MRQEKIDEVFMECYRRMFKEAEPSADIDEIMKSGEGKKEGFFMNYYLNEERQDEIMEEVFKELKVPKSNREKMSNGIILGCSPCANKEMSEKHRRETK